MERELMAAYQHRGGRLFLWADLVTTLIDQWRAEFVGSETEEEGSVESEEGGATGGGKRKKARV